MKSPFATPIRIEDKTYLVAADCELICNADSATPAELAYIVECVNRLPDLLATLAALSEYAEQSTLEGDDTPDCVFEADELLAAFT